MKNSIIYLCALILGLSACIPARKYQEVADLREQCETENEALKARAQELSIQAQECNSRLEVITRQIDALASDTAVLGTSLRILRKQYDKINALNDELLQKANSLRAGSESENRNLMAELEVTRQSLQAKEEALGVLENTLRQKEQELQQREQKVLELQSMINRKDSLVQLMKHKISNALLGFAGKGLTVEERDGRVYVSMEAKLLFPSGSAKVDQQGRQAVIDLAKALQDYNDIDVIVEGHTDTDNLKSSSFPRNNWDLSVLRATSVIDIMMDNSNIDPAMLMAAGRSEYHPVDPNDKAKNRRIEVIITPNLDELFQLINTPDE